MVSYFLRTLINVYSFLILVYILASWVPDCHRASWYQFVCKLVGPYLNLFRKIIPRIGFIDISPVIALLCLGILPFVILRILHFVILNIFQSPWLLQYI
ncbi:YggT family protein [Candidatus Chlamydia sanziniae]|uniref:Cell division protein YlmG/Ycf19 n=1 Tax=Candidatus Chlamydia sanziniae TaxID=1806891 RepID=A0A1A9HUB0_9CHLA|nr:YggT family protein [Candidatus Chlamydia sanziniae]ANH78569.1 Cell division protein YlmG/Ycf19 [Candidatus Chlamydia sanziniae]